MQNCQKRPTIPLPPCLVYNHCLHCRSDRSCPPLIVVAMRYEQELVKAFGDTSTSSEDVASRLSPPA
jgi:hypothetical protein